MCDRDDIDRVGIARTMLHVAAQQGDDGLARGLPPRQARPWLAKNECQQLAHQTIFSYATIRQNFPAGYDVQPVPGSTAPDTWRWVMFVLGGVLGAFGMGWVQTVLPQADWLYEIGGGLIWLTIGVLASWCARDLRGHAEEVDNG